MSDNDLIRRCDAVDAAWEASSLELFTLGPGKIVARINAIPAVQPTVSPDVAALVEALEFYAAWEMEEMEPPTESELDLFDGILNCPMPKAFSDRGEIARAALARVKGVM